MTLEKLLKSRETKMLEEKNFSINSPVINIITFLILISSIFLFNASFVHASHTSEEGLGINIIERTSLLVLQLSVIIFAAWLGVVCFVRLKVPPVLGEILAGVIIGPYCLGQIPFLGFEHGLFPIRESFPVSIELYSIATIASIILLFIVGLETNIAMFIRYSFAGSVVGFMGVLASFILGDYLGVLLSKPILGTHQGFFESVPLMMGVISTATSVGITARILSEKRKMNSPEGVTILSAAVVDDVLGIIILAIVLGMAKSGEVGLKEISVISVKAVGIWLGFTLLGIKYARRLSSILKKLNDRTTISVMSFGLALLLAGIFEKSGLAMIIGAYVMGLSLSKTDLSFIIQEKFDMLQRFFVPVFFCVMGMLINVKELFSPNVLYYGFIYIVFAIAGKLLGCSIPALFLNFNLRGALRVGVGMIPRGEVALIVAGIALSSGIIGSEIFNIVMIMTFVTTLIAPLVLGKMLESDAPILKKEQELKEEKKVVSFGMPNPETAELLINKIVMAFEHEGFFIHRMGGRKRIYQIRKDDTFVVLKYNTKVLAFDCMEEDVAFIHTLFYEVIAELEHIMKNLETLTDKTLIGKKIFETDKKIESVEDRKKKFQLPSSLALSLDLKGANKEKVIEELVDLLIASQQLQADKKQAVVKDLLEREKIMSTGMQDGIGLPHAKTDSIESVSVAVGVCRKGVEFDSLDKMPAKIFVLILTSKKNPHAYLQAMAEISSFLGKEENRQKILNCTTSMELYDVLSQQV